MIQQIRGVQKSCQTRIIGLDLIRSFAILFVISGHFLMNTRFNSTIFGDISLFIQAIFKAFYGIGVPLFLLLTGYLNANKTVSK